MLILTTKIFLKFYNKLVKYFEKKSVRIDVGLVLWGWI